MQTLSLEKLAGKQSECERCARLCSQGGHCTSPCQLSNMGLVSLVTSRNKQFLMRREEGRSSVGALRLISLIPSPYSANSANKQLAQLEAPFARCRVRRSRTVFRIVGPGTYGPSSRNRGAPAVCLLPMVAAASGTGRSSMAALQGTSGPPGAGIPISLSF